MMMMMQQQQMMNMQNQNQNQTQNQNQNTNTNVVVQMAGVVRVAWLHTSTTSAEHPSSPECEHALPVYPPHLPGDM
jgi:hypothetical protein